MGIRQRQQHCKRCGGKGKIHDNLGQVIICPKCKGEEVKVKMTQKEIREEVVRRMVSIKERKDKGIEIPETEVEAYFALLKKVKSN